MSDTEPPVESSKLTRPAGLPWLAPMTVRERLLGLTTAGDASTTELCSEGMRGESPLGGVARCAGAAAGARGVMGFRGEDCDSEANEDSPSQSLTML